MPYLNNINQGSSNSNNIREIKNNSSLGNQMNEIGNTFSQIRNNMPHIVIGKPKNVKPLPRPDMIKEDPLKPTTEQKIFNWALWIAISLVAGYAVYRLINMFMGG